MLSRYSADIARASAGGKFNVCCRNPAEALSLTLCPLLSHRSLAHDHYESIKPQMMSFRCYERNNIARVSN